MKANMTDKIRVDYKGYVEPIVLFAANHQANKRGLTRSEYFREAAIEKIIREGYPLSKVSSKFNEFYKGMPSKI